MQWPEFFTRKILLVLDYCLPGVFQQNDSAFILLYTVLVLMAA